MRRQAGFTLLELLVAMVVLGAIVAALTEGARFGLGAWDRQAQSIARDCALDSTSRTLRTLIEAMVPGGGPAQPAIIGTAHSLAFTAPMPATAPIAPLRLADVALGVDRRQFVLRWTPHLHATVLAPPLARTELLLPGVSGVWFSYYGAPQSRPGAAAWSDAWDDMNPPMLVRVHIGFTTPDRHWPDLVVSPMRQFDDG